MIPSRCPIINSKTGLRCNKWIFRVTRHWENKHPVEIVEVKDLLNEAWEVIKDRANAIFDIKEVKIREVR